MNARNPLPWIVTVSLLVLAGCQQSAPDAGSQQAYEGPKLNFASNSKPNVLEIAVSSADHSTLVAAVQAAGLEAVLVSAGPLTVFAPTDAAFGALPDGTLDELLKPENKQALTKIVTAHAAPGTFKGALLRNGDRLYMATGDFATIEERSDGMYVHGAKILGTVDGSNGVVHVVDKVLLFD
ncbi:MAG: fasciclin domain-containing protein [Rhodothermales bacterium]|nr:fasciclin domain-containing protein [Rhodothermales bacterium]MBO6781478.1 fasciclin domain-containing protein [Rhodothermales bacterium]